MAIKKKSASRSSRRREVAVIGYALRVPGAPNRDAFWQLLSDGRCAVTQVPSDRFPVESYYHPKAGADVPGRSYTFAAGILDDVWAFDPAAFGISPREAIQVDPQQRHLLEVTYEAIEHAGLRPSSLAGSEVGVYVGASSSDYATRFMFDPSAVDVHMMTGNTLSLVSNRLSYYFDLHGPSFTVDTACSSSLVAMHLALEAIREGKIDTAIVGGVNLLLSPFSFIGFSRASMLSPSGLCKAFDASADGYVRAEGALAVVLRAADVARDEGNRVHAVVVGSGINQDGRTTGLSLPSMDAQASLLTNLYEENDLSPDALAFVEAHGTGTRVGDPAEVEALGKVLGQKRSTALPIGSVKTNIGHLEPASGLAGVIKSIMALEHDVLPPSLHFNRPNPDIRFDDLNIHVAAEPVRLPKGRRLRHAGINSFGFGGANAHVVLREPDRPKASQQAGSEQAAPGPLIISAHNTESLKGLAEQYVGLVSNAPASAVAKISNAAAHTRDLLSERIVVADADIGSALRAHLAGDAAPAVWRGTALGANLDVGFVFAGNGSQWAGMGLSAYRANAGFRDSLQRFDAQFRKIAGWSAIETLHSSDVDSEIRRASRAQPLVFALQVASVEALDLHGVNPSIVVGHSVGEIGAAWCAGALDLEGAIKLVLARSHRQEITRHQGSMAAVLVSAEEIRHLLERDVFFGLEIAAYNATRSVSVAGPTQVIDAFVSYAQQERWGVRRLDLDYPFHCALLDPIEHQLLDDLADLKPTSTRIPFISTVTGAETSGESLTAEYWWKNARQPVKFAAGMAGVCESGARVLLEISPRQVLGGYLQDALRSSGVKGAVIPTLGRNDNETLDELTAAASRAVVAGGRVDLARFNGPSVRPAAQLPNYVWQRHQFRFPETDEAVQAYAVVSHPLLGKVTRLGSNEWLASLDPAKFPWLDDHRVEDSTVFPAAGFVEIALAAARETFGDVALELRDLEIIQPLVFDRVRSFEVMTRLSHDTHVLEIKSRPRGDGGEWLLNIRVTVAQAPSTSGQAAQCPDKARETFDGDHVYEFSRQRGFEYGDAFRRIKSVEVFDDRTARASLTAPPDGQFILDPRILDSAFHTFFALTEADHDLPPDALLLPVRFGSVRVFKLAAAVAQVVARVTLSTSQSRVADFDLLSASGDVVAQITGARCRIVQRTRDSLDGLVYRTGFINLAPASWPSALSEACPAGLTVELANVARETGVLREASDVSLILTAGARVAAYDAVKDLAGNDQSFAIPELVARGRLVMSSWPLMSRLLDALSDADMAREDSGSWKLLKSPDNPAISALVEVIMTRYPSWVAEAACLGRLPDVLRSALRKGLDAEEAGPGYSHAVLEHLERGSPIASYLADVTGQAASKILADWPRGKPLRVLVVGAANLGLAARLAPAVTALNGTIAVTDNSPGRLESMRLDMFDPASKRLLVTDWEKAVGAGAGQYDLVLCASSLHTIAGAPGRLEMLTEALRSGGALIAAEPAPSLFADLVHGLRAEWWGRSPVPDFPIGAILSDQDWRRVLEHTELQEAAVRPLGKNGFGGLLVSAVAANKSGRVRDHDMTAQTVLVVADANDDSKRLANLLQPRMESGGHTVPFARPDATSQIGPAPWVVSLPETGELPDAVAERANRGKITDIVFVAATRKAAANPVAALSRQSLAIARLAQMVAERDGVRLWVVCAGAVSGIVDRVPPNPTQAALWATVRVLGNEFPKAEIRCLDLDPSMPTDAAASRLANAIAHPIAERELRLNASGYAALRLQHDTGIHKSENERQIGEAAVRLEIGHKGQFDSLHWRTVARAPLQSKEIEIRVEAAGLNFRDVMWSLGLLPDEALESGFTGPTIGMECAGVVSAVGEAVKQLRVGDRVVAFAPDAFASHVVVHSHLAAKIPEEITTESAATLPVAFLTAYYALVHLANLKAGETVLIHGGAGGVGLAALQIAKSRGAEIIATAGSLDRRELLSKLGAAHVFDSRSLGFADDVSRVTNGAGVDVVLNSLAGEAMIRSLDCLKPFGRFLELGKRDYFVNRHVGLRPFRRNLSYFGVDVDQLLSGEGSMVESLFADLMKKFGTGELVPLPYRAFDAEDAAGAFRLMQRSGQIGKILVRPPRAMPQPKASAKFAVKPRAQYLIVGGLGGFGFATAEWLASKGAKHLVLMSRNAKAGGADAEALAKLKVRGVRVELAAVDIGDRAALERYLLSLANSDLPLKGIFHAAMVIDDGFAKDLNRARIERVLWPKVAGAANLDELTRRFDLDCFVLFSSATVHVGNVGQASYVAANAFLEGLARKRRAEGLPALAVAWGPIQDVGYLARNTATQQALEKRLGRGSLTAAEALVGLDALLNSDQRSVDSAAIAYARIDWALVRKEFAISRTPLYDDLQLDQFAAGGSSVAAEELLSMLRELPANEAEAKIATIISENITRTLQLPAGEVDRNRPLSEFGMDSLMMLELRLAVEEQMGIEIPLMSLTSSLTVTEIGKRLTTMLRDQEKALMSGQMSALTQGHIEMPESAPEADITAAAAAVAKRAKAVDRIL